MLWLSCKTELPYSYAGWRAFQRIAENDYDNRIGAGHAAFLNFASPGTGTSLHLATELFASMADVKLTHIPYKGGAQALPQLIAGETQMMFDPIIEALPLVKAGRLKALAVSMPQRSPMAPEVPTVAESGLPGYDFSVWYVLCDDGQWRFQSRLVSWIFTSDATKRGGGLPLGTRTTT